VQRQISQERLAINPVAMMERDSSMLGKDSTIAKVHARPFNVSQLRRTRTLTPVAVPRVQRKKIAIIAAVVIIVAVAVIGLAVGVSQKNKHSDKVPLVIAHCTPCIQPTDGSLATQPKVSTTPASPPEKPITTKPGDTPAPSDPTLSGECPPLCPQQSQDASHTQPPAHHAC
jgi:hypothetical protein